MLCRITVTFRKRAIVDIIVKQIKHLSWSSGGEIFKHVNQSLLHIEIFFRNEYIFNTIFYQSSI